MATYQIEDKALGPTEPARFVSPGDTSYDADLERAYAAKVRPLCQCRTDVALPLYIARRNGSLVLARMPGTGALHDPECDHFDAPRELNGLGAVEGRAVKEGEDGITELSLGFPLKRGPARAAPEALTSDKPSLKSNGQKLSMRGLLHVLWDQAQLTRWHPRMAGKRDWFVVRRELLKAADGCVAKRDNLAHRLFIPERWSDREKDAIARRQHETLGPVRMSRDAMMIVIGEVKEIKPGMRGERIVLRHLGNWSLSLDPEMTTRFYKRFEVELALWDAHGDKGRLIIAASFALNKAGYADICEVALMPVTETWLPYESAAEFGLVNQAVHEQRHFVKGMRVDLSRDVPIASLLLKDTLPPCAVHVHCATGEEDYDAARALVMTVPGVAHAEWVPGTSLPSTAISGHGA
ncbi:DUF1173 family protein [Novosphingobium acidiphilum]|uniref:DUF1173 family protein n=1 Tax=Novosphingobium acidiphilum TaxID=505248 RepID=UPI00146FB557|nr:DUF1173 family protein [Novosphingobium acidiphilum]